MRHEEPVSDRPNGNKGSCCICAKCLMSTEAVVEERPTGESWAVEDWFYCLDCWLAMKKLREKEINPELLLRVLDL